MNLREEINVLSVTLVTLGEKMRAIGIDGFGVRELNAGDAIDLALATAESVTTVTGILRDLLRTLDTESNSSGT